MPAIAPPDNPLLDFEAAGVPVDEGDEDADGDKVGVEVEVGAEVENVMNAVIVGRTTPAHLCSAPEL
jgi:hypothetical protein